MPELNPFLWFVAKIVFCGGTSLAIVHLIHRTIHDRFTEE